MMTRNKQTEISNKRSQIYKINKNRLIAYHISLVAQKGFSLFEILIVIVIFAVVVFIANQTFIASLKSGTKSDLQQRVKSNSNYIFSVMERSLHSSRKVTQCSGISGNTDASQILYNDSTNTAQSFIYDSSLGKITSSSLGQLNATDVTISASSITCTVTNNITEINIALTLKQAMSGTGLRPEEQDTFQAQTKITTRNDN